LPSLSFDTCIPQTHLKGGKRFETYLHTWGSNHSTSPFPPPAHTQ